MAADPPRAGGRATRTSGRWPRPPPPGPPSPLARRAPAAGLDARALEAQPAVAARKPVAHAAPRGRLRGGDGPPAPRAAAARFVGLIEPDGGRGDVLAGAHAAPAIAVPLAFAR